MNKIIKTILKILTAIVTVIILAIAGIWVTLKDDTRAFNDAIHRGDSIRVELTKYYKLHNKYPSSLKDLKMKDMPGRKWYGVSIIQYTITNSGYELTFGDRFATWDATEKERFTAHK